MIFHYDLVKFKKIHLFRTSFITGIYIFVFLFNYVRLNATEQSAYIKIFVPISFLLFFFLYKNYKKQINILKNSYIELQGSLLRQHSSSGDFVEIDLKKLESIKKDTFRMYARILLEDDSRYFSLLNVDNPEQLLVQIEKISGLKTQTSPEQSRETVKKILVSFLPSVFFSLFFISGKLPFRTAGLVFTTNLLVYLMYQEKTRLTRKLLFITLVAFFAQIWLYLIR